MDDILREIASSNIDRIEQKKKERPTEVIEAMAKRTVGAVGATGAYQTFQDALRQSGLSVIAEIKKSSPSKGVISEDFEYLEVASDYEAGDADAISVLTEPKWFGGSEEILIEVRDEVSVPILRKDFIVDPYQIYEAKVMGADAVLLICALLDDKTLRNYLEICDDLHIDALVEAHDEAEVRRAVNSGALIIGVNNRNLSDFTIDPDNAARLRALVPSDCIFVAESGISNIEDAHKAREAGADAVLVGELLMRADDSEERQILIRGMKDERV